MTWTNTTYAKPDYYITFPGTLSAEATKHIGQAVTKALDEGKVPVLQEGGAILRVGEPPVQMLSGTVESTTEMPYSFAATFWACAAFLVSLLTLLTVLMK